MKLAIAAILISYAAAFAPTPKVASKSSLMESPYENELGVIAPTGFFDPLGLSNDIDEETFAQYRTAELKHGRVAQLAVIGYVVQEIYRFPFDIAPGVPCSSIPNGVAAINAIPALGWAQIFFLIGAVDYYGFLGNFDAGKPDLDVEELEKRQLSELQHGRLAMLAVLELLRHDSQNLVQPGFDGLDNLITGLPFLYN
mmetsp:Transcript_332/g.561  ORF Transcript_332/g.561 Transcript_332/m.561 type:complete len:198 (+) Transcript_332:155-748(+)|eukprot:CAMPEP_0176477902 /NCGR_PEP_ID=MMETSP0200_2-20121128/892_1 /TAXON_ID=947934 /ORGANISM="Chaetoceros sp., Strain GSL56" /LENGTH=197 /DNA_ID=CAMNT_0017873787 /DNA_START=44 /DNA_END=637 /DNA_ORIENTATION=+